MIQVLPSHIANLIAAGEVVQRPSSVVKELMENSVDAGASSVSLILADFGKTLIQVIDNGCGMTKDEAQLCFMRHATSKIASQQDLYSIHTYGFRGEALPSVAACSQVILKTKTAEEEVGTEVQVEENQIKYTGETATPTGTNIQVKNIFYNIPARRKFLKTDNWEYKQCVQEFTRIALTRKNVEFRLIHNAKEVFVLPPVQSIKQRIIQLCGKELNKELVEIKTDTAIIKIRGYIGRPQSAKKSQSNQYLFVNGRYFRSQLLHKAILKAYDKLLPDNLFPSYFVYLRADPQSVDVNIHPTKTEIKFEDENVIFEILCASVKEAIGENAFAPAIDFNMEGVPEIPVAAKNDFYIPQAPKVSYDPLFNPFVEEGRMRQPGWNTKAEWTGAQDKLFENGNDNDNIAGGRHAEERDYSGSQRVYESKLFNDDHINDRSCIVFKNKYIFTTVKSGLMVIDIKRANERILYERFKNALTDADIEANVQELLYPQQMELSYQQRLTVVPYLPELKKLGFDVEEDGNGKLTMYGTPATLKGDNLTLEELIDDLLQTISESNVSDFSEKFRERLTMQLVKDLSGSVGEVNNTEGGMIIDSLFACPDPYTSPYGERCVAIMQEEEFKKLF